MNKIILLIQSLEEYKEIVSLLNKYNYITLKGESADRVILFPEYYNNFILAIDLYDKIVSTTYNIEGIVPYKSLGIQNLEKELKKEVEDRRTLSETKIYTELHLVTKQKNKGAISQFVGFAHISNKRNFIQYIKELKALNQKYDESRYITLSMKDFYKV